MITIKLPKAKTRNVLHLSMIKHGVRKRTFGDRRKRRAKNRECREMRDDV